MLLVFAVSVHVIGLAITDPPVYRMAVREIHVYQPHILWVSEFLLSISLSAKPSDLFIPLAMRLLWTCTCENICASPIEGPLAI